MIVPLLFECEARGISQFGGGGVGGRYRWSPTHLICARPAPTQTKRARVLLQIGQDFAGVLARCEEDKLHPSLFFFERNQNQSLA